MRTHRPTTIAVRTSLAVGTHRRLASVPVGAASAVRAHRLPIASALPLVVASHRTTVATIRRRTHRLAAVGLRAAPLSPWWHPVVVPVARRSRGPETIRPALRDLPMQAARHRAAIIPSVRGRGLLLGPISGDSQSDRQQS
ncbi:MAG: hypothetical protein ABFC96_14975 [Thermoguttaceae bacterium]